MSKATDPKMIQDRIRGCLIAGAAGDALGYAVEFSGESSIFQEYGPKGIQNLKISRFEGKSVISDDTQMTLFTAAGILDRKEAGGLRKAVSMAYQQWLLTQEFQYQKPGKQETEHLPKTLSQLMKIKALHRPRAPGNTCLSALHSRRADGDPEDLDYIAHPYNHSKGCGGVMRTAPAAWIPGLKLERIEEEAAQFAAMTHGHPGGWLPSATGAYLVNRMIFTDEPLKQIAGEAIESLRDLYGSLPETGEFCMMLQQAVRLAENTEADLDHIHALGEGWVGDEALAISLYCALRHENDLSACLIAAVNHRGDSDSTGAIAGNILGARIGYSAIDEKWKTDLELHDEILALADLAAADYLANT